MVDGYNEKGCTFNVVTVALLQTQHLHHNKVT